MDNCNISEDLSDLAGLIGEDLFLKVCSHFAGQSIYFSKSITRDLQKQQIIHDFNAGAGYNELAHRYNYSVSHIRNICDPRNDRDLFSDFINS